MTSNEPASKKPKYLEEIEKLLECPVCFQNPKSPDKVHFCSNGHMICDTCQAQIQRCPVCRSEDLKGQNPLLKQVMLKLPRLCPFSEQGCDVETDGNKMANHAKICRFRLIDCLSFSESCEPSNLLKKVPYYSVFDHQFEKHGSSVSPSEGFSNNKVNISNHKNVPEEYQVDWPPKIMHFDGKIFYVKISLRNSTFWIQCLMHGTETDAENYFCRIALKNCGTNKKYNLDFSGDIISIDLSFDDRRDYPGLFSFSYSMAEKFIDQKGSFSFDCYIKKTEAPNDPDEVTCLEEETPILLD